ncbi:sensor domain-containing diguanylate cyclase [Deinococcus sp. HMF7604]|uniref:GGDEF domain-containing protein n=1 Tax=Deinococcus betulae TaxID=2873312 RepID=UPI001CCEA7DD|nr:sensor domain-containing diguanylate cyclase [Deinococcus betulae]MBZ9753539.1 sensor domain-containing diguanylate cyclase [Deinococcus betulae]
MSAELQTVIQRYQLLARLTILLAQSSTRRELLETVHWHVAQLFVAPVTLLACVSATGDWDCLTMEGNRLHYKSFGREADGLLERVVDGTLRLTADVQQYAREEQFALRRVDEENQLPLAVAWMGVPLEVHGKLLGVLSIQSYALNTFNDQDLEFLDLFSRHFSLALENAALRERLERDARTDELTGLGNRRSFTYAAQRWSQGALPWTLAMIDLQGFKRVNDEEGHARGDQLLRQVGQLLRAAVDFEGEAFRLGGDEFALLLPGSGQENLARLQQLRSAVEGLMQTVLVRLNVGLAESWEQPVLTDLMHLADQRMYRAKEAQRFLS